MGTGLCYSDSEVSWVCLLMVKDLLVASVFKAFTLILDTKF